MKAKRSLIITSLALITSLYAYAEINSADAIEVRCPAANLTVEQKQKIRELRQSSRKEMKQLNKAAKKDKMNYIQTILSEDSSIDQADTAAANGLEKMTAFIAARKGMIHHVLYEIANPDQRKPLMKCFMKKMRQNRRFL